MDSSHKCQERARRLQDSLNEINPDSRICGFPDSRKFGFLGKNGFTKFRDSELPDFLISGIRDSWIPELRDSTFPDSWPDPQDFLDIDKTGFRSRHRGPAKSADTSSDWHPTNGIES